ncbi:MAG: OmpH family outer membrane protein [Bacteroidetes bacterium]|nr:MAG: OmpH family outer membrane protein [Bacteroidota bacterium]
MKKFFLAAIGLSMMASCSQPAAVENTDSGIRLAYVRIDSLQSQYEYFEELALELIEEEKVLVDDLQRRQQTLQENIALYQQEAPKMSARQREANEADLMRVQQQYLQVEQAAQAQLVKKQQDLTKMMREDMDKAIAVLKDELNLDFILLYEEGGQIIYANTDFDITERMVNMLNESRETPSEEEASAASEEAADSTSAE